MVGLLDPSFLTITNSPQAYSIRYHQGSSLYLQVLRLRNMVLLRMLDDHCHRLGLLLPP